MGARDERELGLDRSARRRRSPVGARSFFLFLPERRPTIGGDVVLITVDTLRADHLGLYGYARSTSPRLDRWFADGAIFDRAYATASYTPPSVASILTGQLPQHHGIRLFNQLLPEQTRLVTELLPSEYQTAGFVSSAVLSDDAMGLAERFDHFDDRLDPPGDGEPPVERDARITTDAALEWLALSDPEKPVFLWAHYMDPHSPYDPPDHWPRSFESPTPYPTRIPKPEWLGDSDPGEYLDAYDEEIAFADSQIDRLLAGYDRTRSLRRSLVIFTADHGETLTERVLWFIHGQGVYEELVRVPLMLRGPGVIPGRKEALVSSIDIAPTILAFVGATLPVEWRERDMRVQGRHQTNRTVYAETLFFRHAIRAAIRQDRKWMVRLEAGNREPIVRRIYDLDSDPAERNPAVWEAHSESARRLLELIESDPDPGGLPTNPRRGSETEKRLRALGYVP